LPGSVSLCLRKTRNSDALTAEALLNGQFVNGLIHRDDGFLVLRGERSSPAFWEAKKKELFATIRQLGCTTCSAAETKWTELIVILYQLLNNRPITMEAKENLPTMKRKI
jgi:hypothetical protein